MVSTGTSQQDQIRATLLARAKIKFSGQSRAVVGAHIDSDATKAGRGARLPSPRTVALSRLNSHSPHIRCGVDRVPVCVRALEVGDRGWRTGAITANDATWTSADTLVKSPCAQAPEHIVHTSAVQGLESWQTPAPAGRCTHERTAGEGAASCCGVAGMCAARRCQVTNVPPLGSVSHQGDAFEIASRV